jgi:hypothetical protein
MFKLRGAAPDQATPKDKALTAECDGFNLHAATHFEAADCEAIERFCRYAGRGPLALARLSLAQNGNVVYRLKTPRADGTTHVIFTPLSFLTRLFWLIVQPWRGEIVPRPPVQLQEDNAAGATKASWVAC